MTAKWVENIASVLDKCDIPQVQTALIQEYVDKDGNFVIGKCAMGVLSCEAGMMLTVDLNDELINDDDNYHEILKLYDVPEEFWANKLLPEYIGIGWEYEIDEFNDCSNDTTDENYRPNGLSQLHAWIFRMNDYGMTFKQIAECIRVTFEGVEDE